MGIRSKFKGKNTKKCILKAVLKKNATVVVKLCPKNYLFCIPTNFLPQLFDIFTQIYLPYLWHYATLHPTTTIPNSCCCCSPAAATSQKLTPGDISGIKRAIIDPLVPKRAEINSRKKIRKIQKNLNTNSNKIKQNKTE